MAELETKMFNIQLSKTSLTEALYGKDHLSNSIFTYHQLISPSSKGFSEKKVCI